MLSILTYLLHLANKKHVILIYLNKYIFLKKVYTSILYFFIKKICTLFPGVAMHYILAFLLPKQFG